MKKVIIGILILASALNICATDKASLQLSNGELLSLLDSELEKRDVYVAQRRHSIDSVYELISNDSLSASRHYISLGVLLGAIDVDSAIMAFTKAHNLALKMNDSVTAQRSLLYRSGMMGCFGATPEALHDLNNVAADRIYPENKSLYCEIGRNLYYTYAELFEHTNTHESYILPGLSLAREYQSMLPPDSYRYKLNSAMISFAQKNDAMFLAHLAEIADKVQPGDSFYSFTLSAFGGRLLLLGRIDEAIKLLTLAAINDVRIADKTSSALVRLGKALYEARDLSRAHRYLSLALDNSLSSGAKTNNLLISNALMPVVQEMRKRNEARMLLLAGLAVSLVIAVIMLGRLYRAKRRRAREIEQVKLKLANVNNSKDIYISEFMNLCSSYMESLEDFNRMCRRKITAGQSEDLLKVIKSGKIIEDQRKKFDDIFDDAFLAIYPTFIQDVNSLLLPDKRIVTPANNVLTTELRVLAFTRLGVDDTAQVARFLGVTLNTIYTYRNKLRNKAISRESFDADVMKIGVID